MSTSNRTLKQRIYQETKEFFAIVLYLWVVFALFAMYRSVILAENHIDVASQSFAIVNALALGKVMLIASKLHLGDVDRGAPLMYPTLRKSAIFSVILGLFKILEEAAVGLFRGRSLSDSIAEVGGGTLKGILSLMAILFVVLIPFFAFTELETIVGEGRLKQVFFHRHEGLDLRGRSPVASGANIERVNLPKGASA